MRMITLPLFILSSILAVSVVTAETLEWPLPKKAVATTLVDAENHQPVEPSVKDEEMAIRQKDQKQLRELELHKLLRKAERELAEDEVKSIKQSFARMRLIDH